VVDRGQALTLEGVTAAVLLLAAIGFALQVTAVTPLSPSTSSQHVENQLEATGDGMLASAADNGTLKEAILYWDPNEDEFHGSGAAPFYRSGAPPNDFGDELERSLGSRNVAYNVYVSYQTFDGTVQSQQMVSQGRPSDHAVSASHTITLVDDDRLVQSDGSPGQRVGGTSFYIPDASPTDDGLYNFVRVEVVAWRI
jgi:hypothetical protein